MSQPLILVWKAKTLLIISRLLYSIVSHYVNEQTHEGIIYGDQLNKPGLRFLPELSLSGPTKFIYLCLLVFTSSMHHIL